MQAHTTPGRALAIAAGCAFTAGGLTILLGDALLRPAEWTTYHVLTILTVGGTIAAGHLMADAGRARHYLAALGFLVLFVAGTGLVVYQSVGRQAEVTDTKASSTEARNLAIAEKHADLSRARQRLADAEKMVDLETKSGGCPDRRRDGRRSNCSDWKQRADEVRSHIAVLEGDIATLGAPAPVQPKATKMADVAALLGADHAKAKAALMLLEPFLWTLFFEIGSIVSLGFASRQGGSLTGARSAPAAADTRQTAFPAVGGDPEGSGGPSPGRRMPVPVNENTPAAAKGQVIAWCREFEGRTGRPPSWSEVRQQFRLPRSTASVWRRQACG